jgi:hypothetical protein
MTNKNCFCTIKWLQLPSNKTRNREKWKNCTQELHIYIRLQKMYVRVYPRSFHIKTNNFVTWRHTFCLSCPCAQVQQHSVIPPDAVCSQLQDWDTNDKLWHSSSLWENYIWIIEQAVNCFNFNPETQSAKRIPRTSWMSRWPQDIKVCQRKRSCHSSGG